MWIRLHAIVLACAAAAATAGCTRIDGMSADADLGASKECSADLDCGSGRYCSAGKRCAIDCAAAGDCAFLMADRSAPNTMECSPCGRCIPAGTEDASCRIVTDTPCALAVDCDRGDGREYVCGTRGICAAACAVDDDCASLGRGWACDAAGRWCIRRCFRETDCAWHGWHFRCDLAAGIDPALNAVAESPVYGECVPREGGIDWEGGGDPDRTSFAYRGVWGVMFNTAVRVTGLPVITVQDTVWNQLALAKIVQVGDGIVIRHRLCTVDQRNFNDDDSAPYELEHMIIPDAFIDAMPFLSLPAAGVPALGRGAAFTTGVMRNVRGALLDDPETSPLPTRAEMSHAWDQDRDGKPGITTIVSGVLSGEVYNAQRWWMSYAAVAVDADHLQGLVSHGFENSTLGASKDELLYDLATAAHPQADRSYFRAQRLLDTASCPDVIGLAKDGQGEWLSFKPHYIASERP